MLSKDRERLSWRCVDRRREEPAARRRATDGPFRVRPNLMFVPRSPRSPSPCFIERRVSGDRPGSRRVPPSFPAGSAGEWRPQASAFVKTMQSTRQRRLARKQQFLPARRPLMRRAPRSPSPPRGLCRPVAGLVDFRLTRVKRRGSRDA